MLQPIVANPVSSNRRVSGELRISKSSLVCYLQIFQKISLSLQDDLVKSGRPKTKVGRAPKHRDKSGEYQASVVSCRPVWFVTFRWFKKFHSASKTIRQSLVDLKSRLAMLQIIEANPVSSTWRVSGELSISQSTVVCHFHFSQSTQSCLIVLQVFKILQNFRLTQVFCFIFSFFFLFFFFVLRIYGILIWRGQGICRRNLALKEKMGKHNFKNVLNLFRKIPFKIKTKTDPPPKKKHPKKHKTI